MSTGSNCLIKAIHTLVVHSTRLLTCTQLESEGDGSQKLQVHKAQRERAKVMDKKYIINLTEECIEKKKTYYNICIGNNAEEIGEHYRLYIVQCAN